MFQQNKDDKEQLEQIGRELARRSGRRSKSLLSDVQDAIDANEKSSLKLDNDSGISQRSLSRQKAILASLRNVAETEKETEIELSPGGDFRVVSIQRFTLRDSGWYIDCWCHDSSGIRRYSLSDIIRVSPTHDQSVCIPLELLQSSLPDTGDEEFKFIHPDELDVLDWWLKTDERASRVTTPYSTAPTRENYENAKSSKPAEIQQTQSKPIDVDTLHEKTLEKLNRRKEQPAAETSAAPPAKAPIDLDQLTEKTLKKIAQRRKQKLATNTATLPKKELKTAPKDASAQRYKTNRHAPKPIQIRKAGMAPNAPPRFEPKEDSQERGFRPDPEKGLLERMIVGLTALIEEIRKTGKGATRIELSGGEPYSIDGNLDCYRFSFDSDHELYEGLRVIAVFGEDKLPGRILSSTAEQVFIQFDDAQGRVIHNCVIEIDNTSLLEALETALKDVAAKSIDGFNQELATKTIEGKAGKKIDRGQEQVTFAAQLNPSQKNAIQHALGNTISFIWGPPGTGKTYALGELIRILYEQDRKILVCSNTNQAVDQLLLKLCGVLGKSHKAMDEGHLVRIGKIDHEELEEDWGSYVKLDLIVERKGQELSQKKQALVDQVSTLSKTLTELTTIQKRFAKKRALEQNLVSLEEDLKQLGTKKAENEQRISNIDSEYQQKAAALKAETEALQRKEYGLQKEARDREKAFLKFTKRAQVQIERDLQTAAKEVERISTSLSRLPEEQKKEVGQLHALSDDLQKKTEKATNQVESTQETRTRLEKQLEPFVESSINKSINETEKKLNPLQGKISGLNEQIEKLKESVTKDSKILGATLTKTYLSPKLFEDIDVVIVDEASMATLPSVFFVLGLAKESAVISGDYLQLAPIVETRQKSLKQEIGISVFESAGVQSDCDQGIANPLVTLLDTQYRMPESICDLVAKPFYQGRLITGNQDRSELAIGTEISDKEITIIDTSDLSPVEHQDHYKSRYNLIHGAIVRSLLRQLNLNGDIKDKSSVGVCTPFRAQAKLIKSVIQAEGLSEVVRSGTVHRYQGDEKSLMIVDISDGKGPWYVGMFLQAERPIEDGAKLFNVAITRAKERLIFVANLKRLDEKLPNMAILRDLLASAQNTGRVVPAQDLITFDPVEIREMQQRARSSPRPSAPPRKPHFVEKPVKDDQPRLSGGDIQPRAASFNTSSPDFGDALFRQESFDQGFLEDVNGAETAIVIFSAFITSNRVSQYAPIFREKIAEGVTIRCVTRPPSTNATHANDGAKALRILQDIGCVIDTRGMIHEKLVIIDEEIIWFGSLNPLSHTNKTDEIMLRLEGQQVALQVAAFMSLTPVKDPKSARGLSARKENPECPACGSQWVTLKTGRHGKYWDCEEEECDFKESLNQNQRKKESGLSSEKIEELKASPPKCPDGHGDMRWVDKGQYGPFWGCQKYPACGQTLSLKR